jgi:hypothetical protein
MAELLPQSSHGRASAFKALRAELLPKSFFQVLSHAFVNKSGEEVFEKQLILFNS